MYCYSEIIDQKGNKLLKNRTGNYFGPYSLVNDPEALIPVQGQEANFYAEQYYLDGTFASDWYPLGNVPVGSHWETDRTIYLNTDIVMAKGKFKDGYKEGEWLEGSFVVFKKNENSDRENFENISLIPKKIITEDLNSTYAKGNYIKGKREGMWELYTGDVIISGMFEHGKRIGIWETRKRDTGKSSDKKGWYGFNSSRCFIKGQYKDGLADGVWILYNEHSDTVYQEQLYVNGKYLGVSKDYYPSHKLKMEAYKSGDTLVRKYYSPLGDVMPFNIYDMNSYSEMKDGKLNGKYYKWDYSGNIDLVGQHKGGYREGKWAELGYEDDTIATYSYTNDVLDGMYQKKENDGLTKGMYVYGQKEGDWIETSSFEKRTSYYKYGKEKLINYWDTYKLRKQLVTNGEGMIPIVFDSYGGSPYDIKSKEAYYKNGYISYYKEYYKNGALKSIKYVTARGDSLATYNSPFGGNCVSSGDGVVTEYDSYNRIEEMFFYEGGKLQKNDHYYNGKYASTKLFFISKYQKQPLFKRNFTKVNEGVYIVELNVSDLSMINGYVKISESIIPGYRVEAIPGKESGSSFTLKDGKAEFIWISNPGESFTVSYSLKIPKGVALKTDYEGKLNYISEGRISSVTMNKADVSY